MTKKKEPTYEELSKNLSKEELVESFVFRGTLSGDEKKKADEEFLRLRLQKLKNKSDSQILKGELIRMKLLMQDYFDQNIYEEGYSFSMQLKKYIEILKITHTLFASDIDIHKTKLSRLLNAREHPNIELMYRLEKHSDTIIPATYWYKLHSLMLENEIKIDDKKRAAEYKRVKNVLSFKRTG